MQRSRYELKFVVTAAQKEEILAAAREGLQPDPHGQAGGYRVSSQYFDSPDLEAYREKIDGVAVRRKVRLRFYGEVDGLDRFDDRAAFLEIKHRRINTVFKERIRLTPAGARELLESGHWPFDIEGRVDPRDEHHAATIVSLTQLAAERQLTPSAVITYRRDAWLGRFDHRLRLTFDQLCQALEADRYLEVSSRAGVPMLPGGFVVMELKIDEVVPRWIRDIVARAGVRLQPFSKYTNGIDALRNYGRRNRTALQRPLYTRRDGEDDEPDRVQPAPRPAESEKIVSDVAKL